CFNPSAVTALICAPFRPRRDKSVLFPSQHLLYFCTKSFWKFTNRYSVFSLWHLVHGQVRSEPRLDQDSPHLGRPALRFGVGGSSFYLVLNPIVEIVFLNSSRGEPPFREMAKQLLTVCLRRSDQKSRPSRREQ